MINKVVNKVVNKERLVVETVATPTRERILHLGTGSAAWESGKLYRI
jgi:hypothetical protein